MDYNTLIVIERNGKSITFFLTGNGTLKIDNIIDVQVIEKPVVNK